MFKKAPKNKQVATDSKFKYSSKYWSSGRIKLHSAKTGILIGTITQIPIRGIERGIRQEPIEEYL